jgi:hypothetical protein
MKTTTEQLENLTITRTITRVQMMGILTGVNNPDMISFVSKTPVKMNEYLDYWLVGQGGKKSKNPNPTRNPFTEGVYNFSRKYKIITGFDYQNSVNRRLEKEGKEGNFVGGYKPTVDEKTGEIKQREVWFDIISKGLVTDKKTRSKFYLRYQYLVDSVIGQPEYLYNGNTIEKNMFESYMTQKNTDSYSNQGLDDTLNFQVCDLNNIVTISLGGEVYELVGTI